jgi:hypothetical protein
MVITKKTDRILNQGIHMKEKEKLLEKAKKANDEIAFFEKKGNKLLSEIFESSDWYPECHNDPKKPKCDHCMDCWPKDCNETNCDRVGRCLCPATSCICLGRR